MRRLKERFRDRDGLLPVLDSAMYPFAIYDEVNRAIAEEFYDGDLARLAEVGAYSARKVLTGVYRAFAAGKDFPGFLKRAAVLHERFYSHGEMLVDLDAGGRACQITLRGAPSYSEARPTSTSRAASTPAPPSCSAPSRSTGTSPGTRQAPASICAGNDLPPRRRAWQPDPQGELIGGTS